MIHIRAYEPADEQAWLRCRVLAFLDSAYFDDVRKRKPTYEQPALGLVAEVDGEVVGLIDLQAETESGAICSERPGPRAMIWDLGVHPDHRRGGIAGALLRKASSWAREQGVRYLEAWTRDDPHVCRWYETKAFVRFYTYWHIFMNAQEARNALSTTRPDLRVQAAFAHNTQYGRFDPQGSFERYHECRGYELDLSSTDRDQRSVTEGTRRGR